MRIVLDLQGAQSESRFRGIGRYTITLAKAIVRNKGNHEIYLVLNGLLPESIEYIRSEFNDLLPKNHILVWTSLGPTSFISPDNEWRREVAMHIRNELIESLKPDIVHFLSCFEGYADNAVTSLLPNSFKAITFVTIFDLIPHINPEIYLKPNPRYKEYYSKTIQQLQNADAYFTISESSRQEILKNLYINDSKIYNTLLACDDIFLSNNQDKSGFPSVAYKFGLFQPYIFYTGGADARKNLNALIIAYSKLPQKQRDTHQLVFGGKMPEVVINDLTNEAVKCGLRKAELVFTGYVTDDELTLLYKNCKLFVFPSWHEGFGLPVLEAMACGAPVIGSNSSSLPEVIGLNEALFNPFDVKSITDLILKTLSNDSFRAKLAKHSKNRAKFFSWDSSARIAIHAYEEQFEIKNKNVELVTSKEIIKKIVDCCPSSLPDSDLTILAQSIASIESLKSKKKFLYVDISELIQRDARTGIQRVTRSILSALISKPPEGYDVVPVFATPQNVGYQTGWKFVCKQKNTNIDNIHDSAIQPGIDDILLILDLQHHVAIAQFNYLKTLRDLGTSIFFVVYDLLPVLMPDKFHESASAVHKQWLEIVTHFDGAACISGAVASELKVFMKEQGCKRLRHFHICVFHLGADIAQSVPTIGLPPDADTVLAQIASFTSFLSVGTIEPRKGQSQTLAAFNELWAKGYEVNLVIVGKYGWNTEKLVEQINAHPLLGKHLFWLNGISDEYLEKVYSSCKSLIAASEGEGFGLPLIEAAQHKLPIIARDIPVFKEVAGEGALYFSGKNASDIGCRIEKWLELFKQNLHPQSDKIRWITWDESAAQLLSGILNPPFIENSNDK